MLTYAHVARAREQAIKALRHRLAELEGALKHAHEEQACARALALDYSRAEAALAQAVVGAEGLRSDAAASRAEAEAAKASAAAALAKCEEWKEKAAAGTAEFPCFTGAKV